MKIRLLNACFSELSQWSFDSTEVYVSKDAREGDIRVYT